MGPGMKLAKRGLRPSKKAEACVLLIQEFEGGVSEIYVCLSRYGNIPTILTTANLDNQGIEHIEQFLMCHG
ncbi:hypothetical protein RclHR1_09060004 [Rhizophagus clarus]|uniref:Uncharacterized protein n=1 Tax=Rhizophagus clarus TaxID=94130 RepID=A0A2Z6SPI4_9GLOM|nr:hypothetical protein RclHR1_09060004 [Rhizophagus clarus]